ncbi:MAG: hypothetical protein HYV15_04170, partial [Elusimicrobia bacterium]|nr:hypothetical protein [Elusimicrobiota bacterium]
MKTLRVVLALAIFAPTQVFSQIVSNGAGGQRGHDPRRGGNGGGPVVRPQPPQHGGGNGHQRPQPPVARPQPPVNRP